MQGKSIVSDKYRARLSFAARFGAGSDSLCRRLQSEQAGAGSVAPRPVQSPLLKAVERLIAAQAAAGSAKGPR